MKNPDVADAVTKAGIDEATQVGWCDLLRLSPKGLKVDQPSVDVYRRRLTTLANSVAADIELATKQG